ncbi:MAG: GspE/PulE family protein [Campylobacterales bacterium]
MQEIFRISKGEFELANRDDKSLLLKNNLLPLIHNEEEGLGVDSSNYAAPLAFISCYSENEKIFFLDSEMYENLYTKSLELKKDTEEDEIFEDDDDSDIMDMLQNRQDLLTSEESAPVIQFVNRVFYQAVKRGASDIHIEPYRDRSVIRFRVDGVLQKYVDIPKGATNGIINRVKVISHLDISEKRVPQDGRTQITIGGVNLDIRVSSIPSHFGERIVMRVLMQTESIPTLDDLGLDSTISEQMKSLIKNPHGIILVTGPTGSGKSTTLYSMLQMKKNSEVNIMTIEDPVEYNLEGISQTQVNTKAGLTFASGLRSILRQDPDVILIGEMRDKETSSIAIQSSLTGHLVFSTLHTNDSASSITRLVDLGVERYLVASSLLAVLAQRLVRVLCDECKKKRVVDEFEAKLLGIDKSQEVYDAHGCEACSNSGFKGRKAVGELLLIDSKIKEMITSAKDDAFVKEYAINHLGLRTLKDSALELLKEGRTTVDEVVKVSMESK